MTLSGKQTGALVKMVVPWWLVMVASWMAFGASSGNKETIQLFFGALMHTGIGGKIMSFTGILMVLVGTYVVVQSLEQQVEDQVAYQMAIKAVGGVNEQEKVLGLINKKLMGGVDLSDQEEALITEHLAVVDGMLVTALKSVYEHLIFSVGIVFVIFGILLQLQPRFEFMPNVVFMGFSMALSLAALTGVSFAMKQVRKASVPGLEAYVSAFNTMKLYEKRAKTAF